MNDPSVPICGMRDGSPFVILPGENPHRVCVCVREGFAFLPNEKAGEPSGLPPKSQQFHVTQCHGTTCTAAPLADRRTSQGPGWRQSEKRRQLR